MIPKLINKPRVVYVVRSNRGDAEFHSESEAFDYIENFRTVFPSVPYPDVFKLKIYSYESVENN